MVATDSLSSYLKSSLPIVERLQKAEDAFFAPLNYPPQLKEDVVLHWLFEEALANKRKRKYGNDASPKVKQSKKKKKQKIKDEEGAIASFVGGDRDDCNDICQISEEFGSNDQILSRDDRIAIWDVLSKILCSKRLKSLSSQNWLCPIPLSFSENVISMLEDSSTDFTIKKNIISILHSFEACPGLSARIGLFSNQSESVCICLLKLIDKHDLTDEPMFRMLNYALSETYMHLKAANNFDKTANVAFGELLLPAYRVILKLPKATSEYAEKTLLIARKFLYLAFLAENENKYEKFFKVALKSSKDPGDASCEKFFTFIRQCIEYDSVLVGSLLIKDFLTIFRECYATNARLNLFLIKTITRLVGMMDLFPTSKLNDSVKIFDEDALTISYVSLEVADLTNEDKIQYMYFCLQSVLTEDFKLLKDKKATWFWVQRVAEKFVDEEKFSAESVQCIRLILKANPAFIINNEGFLEKLLLNEKLSHKYGAYDSLMCEVLSLYIQLRKFGEFFNEIVKALLRDKALGQKLPVPQFSMNYSTQNIFPPRFMSSFLSFIGTTTVPLLLNMWKVITEAFDWLCCKWKKEGFSTCESLELCLWLASECIGASSFLEFITLAQYDESITKSMNEMSKAIFNLFEIAQHNVKASGSLMCGILRLCFSWAELHARLLSTDTCYRRENIYKENDFFVKRESYDFSLQIPFVSSSCWIQLVRDTKDNIGVKKIIMQLLIQKVAILGVSKFEQVDSDNESERKSFIADDLSKCLGSIFSDSLLECEENAELMVPNLPVLFKYMDKVHYEKLASIMVSNLETKNKLWENFATSIWFAENHDLQIEIFLNICQNFLVNIFKNRKADNISVLECLLKEFREKHGDFNGVEIIQSLQGLMKKPKVTKSIFRKNATMILNYISILNCLPVYCLKTDFLGSLFTFLVVLLNEMGGFTYEEETVASICGLLNRLSYNPNMVNVFSANESSVVLQWLFKERKLLIDSLPCKDTDANTTFERTFKSICSKAKNPLFTDMTICDLSLELIKNMSNTFVQGHVNKVSLFVKYCIETQDGKNDVIVPECILIIFSAMLDDDWLISVDSTEVSDCLISAAKYCLELSSESKSNLCVIALCLVSFTALWSVRDKKNISKHGLNYDKICTVALQYIRQIHDESIDCMKILSLNFLKELSSSSKFNQVDVSLFINICSKISIKDSDFEIKLKYLNDILSSSVLWYLKPILDKNLVVLESSDEPNVLAFWLVIARSKMKSKATGSIRSSALESVVSTLTLRIPNLKKISDDCKIREQWILMVFDIFLAIVNNDSSNTAVSNVSLILTACSAIDYSLFHGRSFEKVFRMVTKILLRLQSNHFHLVEQRITLMMSVVQYMISSIIDRARQENNLQSHDVQSLETVTISLEKVVESLKRFGKDVSKIGPFVIASIVNGIFKTPVHMAIKARLERMVFLLMDYSDTFGIGHLLSALPPSSIPLLKHLHSEFKDNYVYKQREH